MTDEFSALVTMAKNAGLYVKRTYGHDGQLIEGHYQVRRGDYVFMTGTYEECAEAIRSSGEQKPE